MPTLSDTRAVRDGQRTWRPTTRKNTKPGTPAHDDLVRRVFTADGPSRLWLTDITEHRTAEGKLYLCAVKDVYSRRIVGYSIGDRMKASLAVAALNNAVARRGDTAGCILHSDRGSQAGFNWSSQHPFRRCCVVRRQQAADRAIRPRLRSPGHPKFQRTVETAFGTAARCV